MSASLSLLLFLFAIGAVIPVSILKLGYDSKFPLRRHKFSLPIEIREFYRPLLLALSFSCAVFYCLDYEPNWILIDTAFAPNSKSANEFSIAHIPNWATLLFLCLYYLASYGFGILSGLYAKNTVAKALAQGRSDFFSLSEIRLVGLWGALLNSKHKTKIFLDVLTVGDTLYSGELFYYEVNDDNISNLALKDTKRFLVPLHEIKGNDEKKYSIPGKITYFNGTQIKNINIHRIEQESDFFVFYSQLMAQEDLVSKLKEKLKDKIPRDL